jgi:hypothetical protein
MCCSFHPPHVVQQQDRRPSAAALEQTWHKMQSQQQQPPAQLSHQQHQPQQQLGQGSGLSGLLGNEQPQQQQTPQPEGQLTNQAQLSRLLQQQLGYSLTVRPSRIEHQEAGEEVCATNCFRNPVRTICPWLVTSSTYKHESDFDAHVHADAHTLDSQIVPHGGL